MAISENGVTFFGAGGHKHDGVGSTLINVESYSIFDFPANYIGSPTRIGKQEVNKTALEDFIVRTINTRVLQPSGIILAPNALNGKAISANTITATQIAANTITASEIAANTITASELSSNLILVNNVIKSNNYDGTIASNNVITANGTAGWAITSSGQVEFANAILRGNVTANAGSIGGWTINSSSIAGGSTYLYSNGQSTFGNTTIYSNGKITNGDFNVSSTGALTATGANISGAITASSGSIGAYTINSSLYSISTPFRGFWYDQFRLYLYDSAKLKAEMRYHCDANGDGYTYISAVDINAVDDAIDGARISVTSSEGGNTQIISGRISVNNYIEGPMKPVLAAANSTHIGINGGYISYVTSRREFKEDIQDFTDLGIIDQFVPRIFKWKKTGLGEESEIERIARESEYAIGFIVEEVEEVDNGRFVTYEDSERTKPLYWKTDNFIAMLVAEVQDLRKRVATLEGQ